MKTDFSKPTETFSADERDLDMWSAEADELMEKDDLESVMQALACIEDWYEQEPGYDRQQARTYHKALDWLVSLKARLENANARLGAIQTVKFTESYCDSDKKPIPGTEMTSVMVYNARTIPEDEALDLLRSGKAHLSSRVAMLRPDQAKALFPEMYETPETHERED